MTTTAPVRAENERVVVVYVSGLRPLAARRDPESGGETTRAPARSLFARTCAYVASGLDARVAHAYGTTLLESGADHYAGLAFDRWSYLDHGSSGDGIAPKSVDEAARRLVRHVTRRYPSSNGWRVTLLGHSFGGVIALEAARALADVRVVTVASPLRGATLLSWARALGLGALLTQFYGEIVHEIAGERVVSDATLATLAGRHHNIVCTNPWISCDGRVFASDQIVYGRGAPHETTLSRTRHTATLVEPRVVERVCAIALA